MTFEPVAAEALEALRREDCTAVYNVMKFAGLADADAYSGPELRCLFPDLPLPIIGYATPRSGVRMPSTADC